jgi:hypothetical protein
MALNRLPLLRVLRTLVLGMLALAIVAKPVLGELCDTHALTHLMASAKHVDSAAERRSDRDHDTGRHQTLHAFDASPGYIEPFTALTVPPARFANGAPPAIDEAAPPARAFDSPFRPPIA